MSIRMEGRHHKTVVASFHSLRHTFVSLSANAGVPLPVVQSIVGHCSTAMTRHYYHENLDALRSAVASIPVIGERATRNKEQREVRSLLRPSPVASRLKRLDHLRSKGLITQEEHAAQRERILREI